jgi:hypothetical protein
MPNIMAIMSKKYLRGTREGSIHSLTEAMKSTAKHILTSTTESHIPKKSFQSQAKRKTIQVPKYVSKVPYLSNICSICLLMNYTKLLGSIMICFFLAPSANFAQVKSPPSSISAAEQRFQENITKDRINGVYIPKNLEDAFVQLNKLIDPKAKASLLKIPEEVAASKLHFSLGRWMIVNWNFYEGSRFSNYLSSAGITFPDDMADFMIRAYHRHVNAQPVDFKTLAIAYREMRKAAHQKDMEDAKVVKETRAKKKE